MIQKKIKQKIYNQARRLPDRYRLPIQHKLAAEQFHEYMRERLSYFYVDVDEGPLPPDHITMRTAVMYEKNIKSALDPHVYFTGSYTQLLRWLKDLENCGFNMRTASTIMELGCGSARMLRLLRGIYGVRLIGTDVEADKIEWCRENLPDIEFYVNKYDPPIEQVESGTVDLVYAASVFTHIPLATQDAWLAEMNRILKPGGYLAASVLGIPFETAMLTPEQRRRVLDEGRFELTAQDENVSISSRLTGQWDVFQRRSEVIEVYGKYFQVRDYLPRRQDLLILQKAPAAS